LHPSRVRRPKLETSATCVAGTSCLLEKKLEGRENGKRGGYEGRRRKKEEEEGRRRIRRRRRRRRSRRRRRRRGRIRIRIRR
jgi:hypothetical protein